MNILLATSEAAPFARTGGLGDVCGALPAALARLGVRVTVILPAYRQALAAGLSIRPTGLMFSIPIGNRLVEGELLASSIDEGRIPVYLVRQDEYFDREDIYGTDPGGYDDNCERFVFFSRAVLEAVRLLDQPIDVLHANDWTTGLVPAYLQLEYRGVPGYESIGSLFTVHNLAYQGRFWHWDMLLTGLDWKHFHWQQLEYFGQLNLMKAGLIFADAINTVSPRYAEEIQTAEFGEGLQGVLQHRRASLSGILNGVDYREWNPLTDPYLARNYGPENYRDGKSTCKAALQTELGLPVKADVPLIGFIGRLAKQKGLDLLGPVVHEWAQTQSAQWVILGRGDPEYHTQLAQLAEAFPGKVAARLEWSEPLAHRIEAGADMLTMPSHFEPAGLNQLYSLKYGTVPVVRATGGLANTITDATEDTLRAGRANGFSFRERSALALSEALRRACDTWSQPAAWDRLVGIGMRQDWSWNRSAPQYLGLYEQILSQVRQPMAVP